MIDIELLRSRSALYSFVSALFSYPKTERFALLFAGDYRTRLRAACNTLEADHKLGTEGLLDAADHLFRSLPEDPAATDKPSLHVSGPPLSNHTPPHPRAHLHPTHHPPTRSPAEASQRTRFDALCRASHPHPPPSRTKRSKRAHTAHNGTYALPSSRTHCWIWSTSPVCGIAVIAQTQPDVMSP